MTRRLALGVGTLALYVLAAWLPIAVASASEPKLTYPTGTLLATETKIKATSVGEPAFTSTEGSITCPSAAMTGNLTKNSGGAIEATVESASFPAGGSCSGGHALSINTSPSKNGIPWCFRSTPEMKADEFQIRGGGCGKTITPIRFGVKKFGVFRECTYENAEPIIGSYDTSEDPILTSSTEYERVGETAFCRTTLPVDTAHTLETTEGTNVYFSSGPSIKREGTLLSTGTKLRGKLSGKAKFTGVLLGADATCSSGEWTGTLKENSGSSVGIDIESVSLAGTGTLQTCPWSFLGNQKFTFNGATNGLPWCLQATSEMSTDEYQIRGNSCGFEPRPIRFIIDDYESIECLYEREAALAGTYLTHPKDALLTFEGAVFPVVEKLPACPSQTQLDSSVTLEHDSEGKPLYID